MAEATIPVDPAVGRPLGLNEVFYNIMSDKFDTSHYFEYAVLKSNCCISIEALRKGLEILVNFQPFLRMTVVKKASKNEGGDRERLYFEPCEVKYEDVIRARKQTTDDDLLEIVREEEIFLSREERYGQGPRWRVVFNMPDDLDDVVTAESGYIYRYELFFGMHHQISDAVSGYDILYRQLLPILNKIMNGLPIDEVFLEPLDLTPSFEEEILGDPFSADKRSVWYARAGIKLLRTVNKTFKKNPSGQNSIASKEPSLAKEKGMGIAKCSFGKELVDRILYERKMQEVTVHSILLTAFSFSMIRILEDHGKEIPKEITSGWPIDSRKKLPKYKSPQPLGMFIGTSGYTSMKVPKPYRLDREIFWQKAKEIGRQVSKCVRNQHEKLTLEGMKYLVEQLEKEDFVKLFSELGFNRHFGLSNLGKCSPGQEIDTSLAYVVDAEEVYFGLYGNGSDLTGFPFFTTVVNHKGKIFFIVTYNKHCVEKEIAERLVKYAEEALDQACANNDDFKDLNQL